MKFPDKKGKQEQVACAAAPAAVKEGSYDKVQLESDKYFNHKAPDGAGAPARCDLCERARPVFAGDPDFKRLQAGTLPPFLKRL